MRRIVVAWLLVAVTLQLENMIYYCSTIPKGDNVCSKQAHEVCAITKDGKLTDYQDQCRACNVNDAIGYVDGQCKAIKACTDAEREDCGGKDKKVIPSCGFEQGKPMINLQEYRCCKGTSYTKIIQGRCPKVGDCPPLPAQHKCEDKRPEPASCPRDKSKPVCGVRADGRRRPAWNGCMSCVDTSVISYSDEACASVPRHCVSPGYKLAGNK